eukprot:2147202-Prymnesium_polylepis.2
MLNEPFTQRAILVGTAFSIDLRSTRCRWFVPCATPRETESRETTPTVPPTCNHRLALYIGTAL